VDTELPHIALHGKEQGLDLHIPADWLEQHPLTLNDLEQEAEYLRAIKFDLTVTAQDMAIHH
jgi:exopolyphosphatase/guanosine-5'-triphosphate,3'-diphosphate pyrophosphatase